MVDSFVTEMPSNSSSLLEFQQVFPSHTGYYSCLGTDSITGVYFLSAAELRFYGKKRIHIVVCKTAIINYLTCLNYSYQLFGCIFLEYKRSKKNSLSL